MKILQNCRLGGVSFPDPAAGGAFKILLLDLREGRAGKGKRNKGMSSGSSSQMLNSPLNGDAVLCHMFTIMLVC